MNKMPKNKTNSATDKRQKSVKTARASKAEKLVYKSLEDKLNELPPSRQKKIQKRADELIAQELTLRDLRQALKLTQEDVAEVLHIKQEAVSKLERRSDLLLSTLGAYIESMGGQLTLTATFPNRPPVKLTGFDDINHNV
jgi:DNA-binding transcriptional regulator YiaG